MSRFRDIRLLPVLLVAVAGLMTLKLTGLLLDGGYVFNDNAPRKLSWAQEVINYPVPGRDTADVTGSVGADKPKEAATPASKPADESRTPEGGVVIVPEPSKPVSLSERAVLERLQARRQELDTRAREIEIRDSLLKAAEKRLEARLEELKATEARIAAATERKEQAEQSRLKGLATMYESMKPKDAAKVFDRLEMGVLIEIASQIPPRKMSEVLAQMSAEAAERLTVELARRSTGEKSDVASLPKIEGRPESKTQPAIRRD